MNLLADESLDSQIVYQLRQDGHVVVLVAPSNRLPDLVPLMPNVRNLLNTITPGEVVEIGDSNRQL